MIASGWNPGLLRGLNRLPPAFLESTAARGLRTVTPPVEELDGLAREMHEAFGPDGWLSKSSDFEYRAEQQRMAVEVGQALEKKRSLIVQPVVPMPTYHRRTNWNEHGMPH